MSPTPSPLPEPGLDLWREEQTPTWLVLVPLFIVFATLVALVIVPHFVTVRNAALRQDLTEVLMPLLALNTELERSVAAEAAAVRGYALTGDVAFADRFLSIHAFAGRLGAQVDSLAALYGAEVAGAAETFNRERSAWESMNLGRSPARLRADVYAHQEQFEAAHAAAHRLNEVVSLEIAEHRQRIEEAYQRRFLITGVLAVVALFAGAAALWLAHRLRRNSRHLLRRARDEAALRRIAEAMAEAENLPGALELIVRALAESGRANGVHIEQTTPERGAEVVAAVGEDAPPVGTRMPPGETPASSRDGYRLVVPLLAQGETLGAAVLVRAPSGRPFSEVEAQRARLLADMAALVLQRMGHFDDVRRQEQAMQESAAELRALTESLERKVQERTLRIQELARELTLAEQRERRAIAQILHDDLQQVLFGLQLNLRLLETRYPALDEAALKEAFGSVHDLLGEAILSTRGLTVDLSPPILPEEGIVEALDWLAAHMHQRFGLTVAVHAPGAVPALSEEMRSLLFQTAREMLFNVVKHAQTSRAFVTVYVKKEALVIEVRDEGVGFDPDGARVGDGRTLGGFGLRRARERLNLFGGWLEVTSTPGDGTRASVALPLAPLYEDSYEAGPPAYADFGNDVPARGRA